MAWSICVAESGCISTVCSTILLLCLTLSVSITHTHTHTTHTLHTFSLSRISDSVQQKIFEHALRNVHEISPRALREAVYVLVKECTQFKPTLVVSLLRFLKATRVLDFSAGTLEQQSTVLLLYFLFYQAGGIVSSARSLRESSDTSEWTRISICEPDTIRSSSASVRIMRHYAFY